MTTPQAPTMFRDLWKTVLALGVLTLILGVLVLVWPGISILVAAVLFGAFLVVSGIAQVVAAFRLDVSVGSRVLLFISGALSVVLGVLAFRHFGQGYAVLLLAIWIGVGFIFQGVAEAVLAISHPELPGRGWHIFLGSPHLDRRVGCAGLAVRLHSRACTCHRNLARGHCDLPDCVGDPGPQDSRSGSTAA